ncbi:IS3 family transposase [Streptomyces sp. BPTC-684]|uniref:IS3 family transposase n=1 Tax=Streptomyces sp. BPTC-684 TaxID=3043734 RepID=UPI0024B13D1A|nr:IS3 family transposase [Streptomyces sp. BPTC-684]WHM40999.1 IS3 family transposase [Streptomyces sp. BPTC-684]
MPLRIHAELRRLGRQINRKRIERVMRGRGISGVTRGRRRSLTRLAKRAVPAGDLLGRDLTAHAPGTRLVGDVTYIPAAEGWLYLATWLDLATREVVGYSMADHHRAGLAVDVLQLAAGHGCLEPGCIEHSDRGSGYASGELRCEIRKLNLMGQSMGRTGFCCDNAAAESFFAVLKEEIGTRLWPDRATARAEFLSFTETFSNRRRLRKHPQWGYLTPLETRRHHEQGHTPAA